jgi:transposase-like protein
MRRDRWDKWWQKFPNANFHFTSRHGDHTVLLGVNYRCLDTYSEKQRVVYLGVMITVYHPQCPNTAERFVCRPGVSVARLEDVVRRMAGKVMKQCIHPSAKWVRNVGNCLNEYHCPACGATYQVDSSD